MELPSNRSIPAPGGRIEAPKTFQKAPRFRRLFPWLCKHSLCPEEETIFSGSACKLCRELQGCGLHESSSVLKTRWYSCLSVTCSYKEPQQTHWPKKLTWGRTIHLLCCWGPRGVNQCLSHRPRRSHSTEVPTIATSRIPWDYFNYKLKAFFFFVIYAFMDPKEFENLSQTGFL